MSRSYRKVPLTQDSNYKHSGKRFANKKVRRYLKDVENDLSFSVYKKVYESWNISDYTWGYFSYQDYYKYCRRYCKSDEECWANFKKNYLCK